MSEVPSALMELRASRQAHVAVAGEWTAERIRLETTADQRDTWKANCEKALAFKPDYVDAKIIRWLLIDVATILSALESAQASALQPGQVAVAEDELRALIHAMTVAEANPSCDDCPAKECGTEFQHCRENLLAHFDLAEQEVPS